MTTTTTTPRHELVPQLRFPPGYRFVPTEAELVDVYLRAKIEGRKLPLDVVNDVSILDWQPGPLVEAYKGYGENRWFFFTVREQSSSNKEKEPSRKVRVPDVSATWKATGSLQLIRRPARPGDGDGVDGDGKKVVVGSKRVLIYSSNDPDENGKWSMHEYILDGHAKIGEYALYSIQRKQHSETEDKAGEKKRKRTENNVETELEEVQPAHPETTTALLAEPPLKPAARKAKAQRRKKKPSMQVGVEGEQQQQQQGHVQSAMMEPVTPPKKEGEIAPPQQQQEGRQQQQPLEAADGAPPQVLLSAVPLPAAPASLPPEPDRMLDDEELLALLNCYDRHCSNNQGQEQWAPTSLPAGTTTAIVAAPDTNAVVVDHAPSFQPYPYPYPYQQECYNSVFAVQNQHLISGGDQGVYMCQGQVQVQGQYTDLFLPNTNASTPQPMNSSGSSENGDDQLHQLLHHQLQAEDNNEGAFGVAEEEQQPNLFGESSVQMDAFVSVRGPLHPDEPPQHLAAAGTQEGGHDPATLQAAGTQQEQRAEELRQLAWLQQLLLRPLCSRSVTT